ncbi:hypothetical protein L8106_25195, partial [Lyngbya sp. PCC 8106]
IRQSIKNHHLSFTEACMTAIAIITVLVLQTQPQNSPLGFSLKQNLSLLTELKTD